MKRSASSLRRVLTSIVFLSMIISCRKDTVETEQDRLGKLRSECEKNFQSTLPLNAPPDFFFIGNIKGNDVRMDVGRDNFKGVVQIPEIISSTGGTVTSGHGSNVSWREINIGIWGANADKLIFVNSPHLDPSISNQKYIEEVLVPGKLLPISGEGKNPINVFSVEFGFYCNDPLNNGITQNGEIILTSGYLSYSSWAGTQSSDSFLKVVERIKVKPNVYRLTFEMQCKLYSTGDHHYFGELKKGKLIVEVTI